ncbi:MAG: tryptophan synthase subunit alpha [Fidelibacterota bacterium]
MNYNEVYDRLKTQGKIAFVPFTMLGFPNYAVSLEIIKTIIDNGADILELGLPFSDPVADGPVIQEANTITLANGFNTEKCFQLLADIRQYSKIPIGLLVYGNLIYHYGIEKFYKRLGDLKINSVLIPDIPPEECDDYLAAGRRNNVESVFIITPITPEKRLNLILEKTTGFIYLISRLGVTGTHKSADNHLKSIITKIQDKTNLPINVGFGISTPEHLKNLKKLSVDGGIIGSAIIKIINKNMSHPQKLSRDLTHYLKTITAAK